MVTVLVYDAVHNKKKSLQKSVIETNLWKTLKQNGNS